MIASIENSSETKEVIQYAPFQIKVKADYTEWGKSISDIDDVLLVIKKTNSNSNDDFLNKDYQNGSGDILITDVGKIFTININQTDFTKLKPDTYSIRLGLKFTGENQFRDVGVIQNGTIKILQSWFDEEEYT